MIKQFIMAISLMFLVQFNYAISQSPNCGAENLWGENYNILDSISISKKILFENDSLSLVFKTSILEENTTDEKVLQIDIRDISTYSPIDTVLINSIKLQHVFRNAILLSKDYWKIMLAIDENYRVRMKTSLCIDTMLAGTMYSLCNPEYCLIVELEVANSATSQIIKKKEILTENDYCTPPCQNLAYKTFDEFFKALDEISYPTPNPCVEVCYWTLNGNSNVEQNINFIGPTNGSDFIIKTGGGVSNMNAERMRITSTGNVGIGIDDPSMKFEVHLNTADGNKIGFAEENFNPSIRLHRRFGVNCGANGDHRIVYPWWIEVNDDHQNNGGVYGGLFFKTGEQQCTDITETVKTKFSFLRHGNMGIGLTNPQAVLELSNKNNNYDSPLLSLLNPEDRQVFFVSREGATRLRLSGGTTTLPQPTAFYIENADDDTDIKNLFTVKPNGNVGIGVSQPNHKLVVDGKIIAEEVVIVQDPATWPDYVFADDYKLASLFDVEQFIKANRHLPEIPSANEVQQNGVGIGEIQGLLLKKIEELTLHLIELKKENEEIKKRLEELE